MKLVTHAAILLSAATFSASANARSLSDPAAAGTRAYTFQVIEVINANARQGFRMNFDLVTADDGSIDAVVRSADETADGKTWTAAAVTDACKTAMHAPAGAIARVHLWPPKGDAATALGQGFLDNCAPNSVFLPLTDILNVAIIPVAAKFKVQDLKVPGDTAHYDSFVGAFNRTGQSVKESVPGGDVTFVSLSNDRAVIEWANAPADFDLLTSTGNQPMRLTGKEHFAFRLALDAKTGALIEAHTTFDDLDLVAHMPGVPDDKAPPMKINRTVQITPR